METEKRQRANGAEKYKDGKEKVVENESLFARANSKEGKQTENVIDV